MPSPRESASLCIALVGNPNTGKSTLFTALVGVHQRTGNYPGVTVEKKTGQLEHAGRRYTVVDLPGIYSLAPHSRDEMVTVDVLLGRLDDTPPVDTVVCIVDASNLERNLYLVSQVLELGLPTVLALNMLDVAAEHEIEIDADRLERQLGVAVVPMRANRGVGVEELKAALARVADHAAVPFPSPFPYSFEEEVTRLESALAAIPTSATAVQYDRPAKGGWWKLPGIRRRTAAPGRCGTRTTPPALPSGSDRPPLPRPLVRRLLLDVGGYLQSVLLPGRNGHFDNHLKAARKRLAAAGCPVPRIETTARYGWAHRVLEGVVTQPGRHKQTISDRIDQVLTHRLWGTVVFAIVMLVVFQSVFVWAQPLMNAIGAGVKTLGGLVAAHMAEGALRSLLIDGVLGGVGGVLTFIPQILILFFFSALLEDCGYMARAAYLMDSLMVRVGLSGKSFIPLLSSFACAIPGIMATRVIENERDRLTTILVAPLMTCSARLPIYALMIAAFIPERAWLGGVLKLQGLTLAAMYFLGIIAAVTAAKVFKRTLLRGDPPPFVMELPSYKWPSPRTVIYRVLERAFSFVRFAGTLILAVSVLVWAALYYPHNPEAIAPGLRAERQSLETSLAALDEGAPERAEVNAQLARLDREVAGQYQRQSLLGRFGRLIEPVFRPLGWDWRIGSAVIASFPAREVVVATLGVVFNSGEDSDSQELATQTQFHDKLRRATWDGTERPLFTIPVALSVMVFFALCAQCAATLAVIRHETNGWRWPLFTFGYMTTLAYLGALVTYQAGTWLATWIGG